MAYYDDIAEDIVDCCCDGFATQVEIIENVLEYLQDIKALNETGIKIRNAYWKKYIKE